MSSPTPYGFPAIGNQEVFGPLPLQLAPAAPVQVASLSEVGVTTTQTTAPISLAGHQYAFVLFNLSAIAGTNAIFRVRGAGAFYTADLYKATLTAVGFGSQSLGPGMSTPVLLLPGMFLQVDVTAATVSYTFEMWAQ